MVSVIVSLSHAEVAKSAEFYFPSVFHAGAGVVVNFVTTRVRRELNGKLSSSPPVDVIPCAICGDYLLSFALLFGYFVLNLHQFHATAVV